MKLKKMKSILQVLLAITMFSCNNNQIGNEQVKSDSIILSDNDTLKSEVVSYASNSDSVYKLKNEKFPVVIIYNFHVTNRCPSCIAIEDATTKTLNQYYSKELKSGRIKRYIVNVDDEKNKQITEKYEAFGSGLLLVRDYNSKEITVDLTGDGFKYARNKEDKFINILKTKIDELLN